MNAGHIQFFFLSKIEIALFTFSLEKNDKIKKNFVVEKKFPTQDKLQPRPPRGTIEPK
jgi:hypothetical protein